MNNDDRSATGTRPHGAAAMGTTPKRLQDDCFRIDQPRLRHAEAIAILRQRGSVVCGYEQVGLADCGGRVLAAPVVATRHVPAHTNAAVDGYAFRATPETQANGARRAVEGRAAAGHPSVSPCAPHAAVRILTGAMMPDGADTVVMQEDVVLHEPEAKATDPNGTSPPIIEISAGLKRGANVRKAGEDVAAGTTLFEQGHVLRPQDAAALASIGLAQVTCFAKIRVGIVSTGDEIVTPGSPEAGIRDLRPGQVFDANAPMLAALCRNAGADVQWLGIWPDRLDTIIDGLREAASSFDVILTTGGASMGEEDHMAAALGALGQRHMWQLAIKPGRPMMFGQIASRTRDTVVVGLPGNPVAVFVCYLMYAMPLLRALSGAKWTEPRRYLLPAAFAFAGRKTGRREFWRGMLVERDGRMTIDKFARDGSGLISGLTAADGLIEIAEDHGDVAVGDLVPFIPLSEFGVR